MTIAAAPRTNPHRGYLMTDTSRTHPLMLTLAAGTTRHISVNGEALKANNDTLHQEAALPPVLVQENSTRGEIRRWYAYAVVVKGASALATTEHSDRFGCRHGEALTLSTSAALTLTMEASS